MRSPSVTLLEWAAGRWHVASLKDLGASLLLVLFSFLFKGEKNINWLIVRDA